MAINNETERRSALGMLIMALAIAPVPDTLINAPDRKQVLGIFAGIHAGIATTNVHILSTGPLEPNHISDSGDNLLIAGTLEVQHGAWFGDASNYSKIDSSGKLSQAGDATWTVQDGSDIIVTANDNAGPFISATQDDSAVGPITMTGAGKINPRDSAIGIYSQADTFMDLFADGAVRIGNSSAGAPTTYQNIESDGDTFWVGAGTGLPYGSFWGNEIAFVSAGGTGTFFEIVDANITVGQTNLATFQNNKELAVTKAGVYHVVWSMSVKATGANKHIVGGIGVDAGGAGALTIQNDGASHAVSTGNAEFSIAGTAILDLSASSEVGLMATNETDNTNVTVEHVTLSVVQVGGT